MDLQENLIVSPTCLVGFTSMGEDCGDGHSPFECMRTFAELGCATVLMRDRHLAWYQCGVEGVGDIDAVATRVARLKLKYPRVITTGISMGGYAALLFGLLGGADEIVAMSPQTCIDLDGSIVPGDARWRAHWRNHMPQILYPDLSVVGWTPSRMRIFIGDVGDPDCGFDRIHADRMEGAEITVLPGCTHTTVGRALRDSGFFRELVK